MFAIRSNRYTISCKISWRLIVLLISLAFAGECNVSSANKETCSTPGCKDAARLLQGNMDEKEKPCDDFYKFSCGGFIKTKTIPNNQYHIGHMSILQHKILEQIKAVLEEKINKQESRIFELAKNYYKSCLNESTRDQNLKTLLKIIEDLGGWPVLKGSKWQENSFNVFETDRILRQTGYQPNRIFNMYAFPNLLNTSQSVLYIGPPEPLLKSTTLRGPFMSNVVQAYFKYMIDVAVLLGANRKSAEAHFRRVIDFEKDLITGISEQTILNAVNLKSIKELYGMTGAGNYPWEKYINNMIEPIAHFDNFSIINIMNLDYFEKAIYVLNKHPKKTVANYMIWKVLAESMKYLPDEYREKAFEFDKMRSEKEAPPLRKPRWRECVDLMTDKKSGLGVAVSSMYIRKYFNDTSRKDVEPIVSSVANAFNEVLNKITWMHGSVKEAALKKVEYMRKIIAYPDELLNNQKIDDYSRSLQISSDNHFQNFLNLQRFHYEFGLSNLGKSTEENLWEFFTDSTKVSAYYYSLANTFVLLASILQQPLFNPKWPSYATFGSMGFIIGHEIMHAYDAHRIVYNGAGDLTGWMNGTSKDTFLSRTQCFLDQYSGYKDKQTDMKLDSSLTLNENVADTGGLKIAYLAYRHWVKKYGEDPRPSKLQNYSSNQLFFVSAINFLCGKTTKEQRRDDLKNDPHTPDDFRTLGMISNSKEFAQAYSCPLGSPMNPATKCNVWE